jgi:glutathione S-transferase
LNEEIPQILDYLETQLPPDGFIFGDVSIADIAIAVFFRNAAFVRFKVDAQRWPITAAFVDRMLGSAPFRRLKPFEDKLARTPITEHRAALSALGAPLMRESFGTPSPRPGVMRI